MLPTRHLPALAAAERVLGRLDAALADPAVRRRRAPDAARRTALALARLDGTPADPDAVALARRPPRKASHPAAAPRRCGPPAFSVSPSSWPKACGTRCR